MGATVSTNNRVIRTSSQLAAEIDNLMLNNRAHQDHDQLISSFLEIAVGHTVETAREFLQTTDWNLEEAINLFLVNRSNDSSMYHYDQVAPPSRASSSDQVSEESDSRLSSFYPPPFGLLFKGSFEDAKSFSSRKNRWLLVNLQSRTEFASHTLNKDVWSDETVLRTVECNFVLLQLYDHRTQGQKVSSFYKIACALPVVLLIDPITGQKMRMWSGVIEAVSFVEDLMNFMDYDPHKHIASLTRNVRPGTEEICSSSNNTDKVPAPSWGEEFEEEDAYSSSNYIYETEDSSGSTESVDHTDQAAVSSQGEEIEVKEDDQAAVTSLSEEFEAKEEENIVLEFPDLTEEPKEDCDRNIVCSLCVRYPDGRRKQRKFLKSEPIQLLWSFCYSHMKESERKVFKLVHAVPGASKILDYGVDMTFDQSGLANSMVSIIWE